MSPMARHDALHACGDSRGPWYEMYQSRYCGSPRRRRRRSFRDAFCSHSATRLRIRWLSKDAVTASLTRGQFVRNANPRWGSARVASAADQTTLAGLPFEALYLQHAL